VLKYYTKVIKPPFSFLDQCLIWSVDDTFDSAPTFFIQVFTINARLHSEKLLYEASILHTNRGDDKLPPAAERRKSLRIEHVHADFLKFDLMDYLDNMVNAIDNEINVSKFAAVLDKYKEVDLEECEIF
jgi:hypothetical protein